VNQITATRPPSPVIVFRDRLLARRNELVQALEGSGISPDLFIRTATTAVQMTPELAEVSFQSFWMACLKATRDQLLPDGVQGAIVPFKKTATWIPMYRGLISRFERSGHYRWIHAGFHRANDKDWRIWVDEQGQHFLHEPVFDDSPILETYACATTTSGAFFITVVSQTDMERIQAYSKASREDAPWNKWPEEMMKKTALRRLSKLLPTSPPASDFSEDSDERADEDEALNALPPPRPRGVKEALDQFGDGGGEDHAAGTENTRGHGSGAADAAQSGRPAPQEAG
jgi:recombination protein RecT